MLFTVTSIRIVAANELDEIFFGTSKKTEISVSNCRLNEPKAHKNHVNAIG